MRARLPEGVTDYTVDYSIVGEANDLAHAFFVVNTTNAPNKGARLLFQAAPRYARRAYNLDYVVNTLGVNRLRVEANISYVNAAGDSQYLKFVSVPVTIRAAATNPGVNAFLDFEGMRQTRREIRTRVSAPVNTTFRGFLNAVLNATVSRNVPDFTTMWTNGNYRADTNEPTPVNDLDLSSFLLANSTTQRLSVTVTITSFNATTVMRTRQIYRIAAGTPVLTINGNSSVDGSFRAFLKAANQTTDIPAGVVFIDARDELGPNVMAVEWRFDFNYLRAVPRRITTVATISNVIYTSIGYIDENMAGRTKVRGARNADGTGGINGNRVLDSTDILTPVTTSSVAGIIIGVVVGVITLACLAIPSCRGSDSTNDPPAPGSPAPGSPAPGSPAPGSPVPGLRLLGILFPAPVSVPGPNPVPTFLRLSDVPDLTNTLNILDTLGIRIKKPLGFLRGTDNYNPTVYFRVRNANSNNSAYRCQDAFYLDHQGYDIKVQAAQNVNNAVLNHEEQDVYGCRLEASLRGVEGTFAVVQTGALTGDLSQIRRISGIAVAGSANATRCGSSDAETRLSALRAGGCNYQASLEITVNDLNEPVILTLNKNNGAIFEADVSNLTDRPAVGIPLNLASGNIVLTNFSYREQDEDRVGNSLRVSAPTILAVRQLNSDWSLYDVDADKLFFIEQNTATSANLMLNATTAARLDYESLISNATGQRGYQFAITARDNNTRDLITGTVFTLEIQDVVYAPEDFTYDVLVVNGTEGGAEGPLPEQHLLPGFAQFVANGGPALGRLSARDPEANTSVGISYQYRGVLPLDLNHNNSFALSPASRSATADELLLVGLGLRDGAEFTVQLRATNDAAPMEAVTDLDVRTLISYAAAPDNGFYAGEPPITFERGVFSGNVVEGREDTLVRRNATTNEEIDKIFLLGSDAGRANARFYLMTNREIDTLINRAPNMLREDVRRALAGRLAELSGSEQFNLNETTGELSLRQAADFTAQPVYTLLLRVSNTTDRTSAADLSSDYAVLQVVVEDTNTAPRIVDLYAFRYTAATRTDPASLTFELPEDTRVGRLIAILRVEDDNPLTDLNFDPAAGATAYKIEHFASSRLVEATENKNAHYTHSYYLVTVQPDYEINATLDLRHVLRDGGRYAYDVERGQAASTSSGYQSVSLQVNGTITDINEAPQLAFVGGRRDPSGRRLMLNEDAARNAEVVQVRVTDPEGLAANLSYDLITNPSQLTPVFNNVSGVTAVSTNNGREATWALRVADTEALENAGDGLIFTLTLRATEPGYTGLSVSEQIEVEITDVVHPFDVSKANTMPINITEQDALDEGRGLVLRDNLFRLAEVQPDYDEFFFGTYVRFGDVTVQQGALTYATDGVAANLVEEEQFNLLTLRRAGLRTRTAADDGVALLLGEEELIEPNLLGERVTLAVELTDPAGGVEVAALAVPVNILPTRPAGLAFGSADAAGPRVPAAYNFAYQQSPYVAALGAGACVAESGAYNITIAGQCYPTVWVEDAVGRASYVARDASAQEHFVPDRAPRRAANNQEIGIIFADVPDTNITLSEDVLIYGLDGEGNLQDARAAFETYFTLTVNNSYARDGAARPALALRHRNYAVLNRTSGAPLANETYAALDTVPLAGLARERTLSYFLVAVDGTGNANNASHRAIAQVNVAVTAVGNAPAEVRELRLADTYDLGADTATRIAENGLPDLVNNPALALNITVANPDAVDTNQSVDVVVDVVAARTSARSDGAFNLTTGAATGNELVRLGPTATSNFTFTLGSGVNRSAQRIPFQLARNAHGTAFIRVTLHERDRNDAPVRDGLQTLHYELVVSPGEPPAISVVNLTVADQISGQAREDGFGTATPELRFLLNSTAFAPPWAQRLAAVAVTTTSRQAFDILTPRGAVQFDDGARAETKEARQGLNYAEHTHGITEFRLSVMTTEGRGFGERAINVTRAPAPAFNILSVNDALQALSDVVAVDFRLERDFDNTSATSIGRADTAAAVFFADVDLATGDPLPAREEIQILPGDVQTIFGDTTIQLNADNLNHGTLAVDQAPGNQVLGAPTRIRVEVPDIALTLTQAQYNAINARGEAITLNFTVNVPDSGDASLQVNATAQVTILLTTSNATVMAEDYAGGAAQLNEGTAPGTPVFATNLTLRDDDLGRPAGDTYTYTLAVTRAGQPVPDLIGWNRGAETAGSWRDVVSGQPSDALDLAVVLARRPDDADVGEYQARWTMREQRGAEENNRQVAAGAFNLTIVNVDDPVTVFCDLATGTDCGYQGARFDLQEIFGEQQRGNARIDQAQNTGQNISVIFEDLDLLAPGALDPGSNILPKAMNVSLMDAVLTVGGADFNLTDGAVGQSAFVNPQHIALGRINVTLALHLILNQTHYDALNADADGGRLEFGVMLRSGAASATARAQATIRALANLVVVEAEPTARSFAEGTTMGAVAAQLQIRDADGQRSDRASVYTYTLAMHNRSGEAVAGLLIWDGGNELTRQDAPSAVFNRSVAFANEMVDADVAGSPYTVAWTVADDRVPAGSLNEVAGTFRLAITNVDDPLRVVCDADNAGEDCGFTPARYVIPGLNPAVAGNDLISSAANVTVLFSDDDLLAGLAPNSTVGNFMDADPDDEIALNATNFMVNTTAINVRRVGNTNRMQVTLPVRLRLTQTQFDTINASGEAVSLRFNFTLANTGGSDTVAANGSIELQPDADGDGIGDAMDNCPFLNSQDQRDADRDGIGDVCEAQLVSSLSAVPDGPNAVNLTWTNPRDSVLQLLNISYGPTNDQTNRTTINITAATNLAGETQVTYQITGLSALTDYTFTVSGIDFRHGQRNQTLPEASVDATTPVDPNDVDNDGIANADDNCPVFKSLDQNDADGDGIGDACEVEAVLGLRVVPDSGTAVNLYWTNPEDSDLLMLNITYGPTDDPADQITVNLTADGDLAAGAQASHQFAVGIDVWYTFTVSGIDFRHGARNQTLPLTSTSFRTRLSTDGDGIADDEDNCFNFYNPDQMDSDNDTYGDACGPDRNDDGIREIQTAAQLDAVRHNLSANYALIRDIDLSPYANWQPLGNFSSRYTGVFDGNGHTIANLSTSGYQNAGLFGVIAGGGGSSSTTLADLTLRVKHIRAVGNTTNAGGLAGRSDGTIILRNVHVIVAEDISVNYSGGIIAAAGGLIGRTTAHSTRLVLSISNSSVFIGGNLSILDNDVGSVDSFHAGGLVGAVSVLNPAPGGVPGLEIDDSYARVNGSIVFHSQGGSGDVVELGGLGGRVVRDYRISNAYAFSSNITTRGFGGRVSGLVGISLPTSPLSGRSIVHSYFAAPVSQTEGRRDSDYRDNSPHKRSLRQLECPTVANATCEGATTYTGWARTIWDFGDDQTLPDLRARPEPLSDLLP